MVIASDSAIYILKISFQKNTKFETFSYEIKSKTAYNNHSWNVENTIHNLPILNKQNPNELVILVGETVENFVNLLTIVTK